tara:strand:+ start:13458 stop:13763 length:306 start_codon:yes stop_codon:yes gene_type:complete
MAMIAEKRKYPRGEISLISSTLSSPRTPPDIRIRPKVLALPYRSELMIKGSGVRIAKGAINDPGANRAQRTTLIPPKAKKRLGLNLEISLLELAIIKINTI